MLEMRKLWFIWIAVVALAGCANRGIGPQGGPKDSIPPVPLRCEPEMGALNFKGKRIEVTFNEYIQLNNVAQNLMMSPPQQNPPDVKARGKKLIVQFQDTLRDSTTYTIDFGSAICDYREKVPLHGYSFYFSTGNEIDTLESRGYVYDAETLNPLPGITVGIYSNMADTAFVREPFLRIAKTDSVGGFRIGNIHPGAYRLYAVEDISRDYRLTVGEALAFSDELLVVTAPKRFDHAETQDTLNNTDSIAQTALPYPFPETDSLAIKDSLAVLDSLALTDSLATTDMPQLPEVTLSTLFLFKEQQKKLYLQKVDRDKQHRFRIFFSAEPDSLPQLHSLNDSLHYHTFYSPHRDSLTVWLTDSMSIAQDSLFFEIRYRQTDSLYNLEWFTDTLRIIWREPKLTAKAKEAQEREARNRRLELKTNAKKGFEIYDTLRLTCTTPLAEIVADSIHLLERVDTVFKPIPFSIAYVDTLPMTFALLAELKPEGKYELRLDSAALHDIYGISHVAAKYPLEVKALTDYSTLRVKVTPFDTRIRIQLLSAKDQVLRELPAVEEGAFFEYLKPDTYYMRLYVDENEDGKWTTGSWDKKRQPEEVYYFPGKVQTKSNWDFEEEWDYLAVPRTQAKPQELIKASPKKK